MTPEELVEQALNKEEPEVPEHRKDWDDTSVEEKINRMRNIIKSLQHTVNHQQKTIVRLENHDHVNGKLVTNMHCQSMAADCATGTSFDYF